MKNLFIIIVALIPLAACQNADTKTKSDAPELSAEQRLKATQDTVNYTSIQWLDSTDMNLGKIKKGATVEVTFHFKNTGTKPLVIGNVSPGCGCTISEEPKQPFAPGEEGVIKSKFETKSQHAGAVAKTIYVTSNTQPQQTTLVFRAEIIE